MSCGDISADFRHTFAGHRASVTGVSFSPDGQIIATCSYDSTCRLWDATSGQLHITFVSHTDPVTAIAFSPFLTTNEGVAASSSSAKSSSASRSSWILASTSQDKTCRFFGPRSLGCAQVMTSLNDRASTTSAPASDVRHGEIVAPPASLPSSRPTLQTTSHGHQIQQQTDQHQQHHHQHRAQDSNDGGSADDADEDAALLVLEHTHSVFCLCFSPTHVDLLATGGYGKKICFWTDFVGKVTAEQHNAAEQPAQQQEQNAQQQQKPVAVATGHTAAVRSLSFSPDGATLVSASADKSLRVWSVSLCGDADSTTGGRAKTTASPPSVAVTVTLRQVIDAAHSGQVAAVVFSRNHNDLFVSSSEDRTIRLWAEAKDDHKHDDDDDDAALPLFIPQGRPLVGHTDCVSCLALASVSTLPASSKNSEITPPTILLASGSYDRTIRLWSISNSNSSNDDNEYETKQEQHQRYFGELCANPVSGGGSNVRAVAFSSQSSASASASSPNAAKMLMAVGNWDQRVRTWEISSSSSSLHHINDEEDAAGSRRRHRAPTVALSLNRALSNVKQLHDDFATLQARQDAMRECNPLETFKTGIEMLRFPGMNRYTDILPNEKTMFPPRQSLQLDGFLAAEHSQEEPSSSSDASPLDESEKEERREDDVAASPSAASPTTASKPPLPQHHVPRPPHSPHHHHHHHDCYHHHLHDFYNLSPWFLKQNSYFNANLIDCHAEFGTPLRFIASQAPTPRTIPAFWKAVLTYRIPVVVMLTRVVERSVRKADVYWPFFPPKKMSPPHPDEQQQQRRTGDGEDDDGVDGGVEMVESESSSSSVFAAAVPPSLTFDNGITVRLFAEKVAGPPTQRLVRMELEVSHPAADSIRIILFRYEGWPDRGVPATTFIMSELVTTAIETAWETDGYNRPIAAAAGSQAAPPPTVMVMCSAGIGRTGSFIAFYILREILRFQKQQLPMKSGYRPQEEEEDEAQQPSATTTDDNQKSTTQGVATAAVAGDDDDDKKPKVPHHHHVVDADGSTDCAVQIARRSSLTGATAAAAVAAGSAVPVFDAALTIPSVVEWLKRQRCGAVQTFEQYEFLYKLAAEEAQRIDI